jgi:hypothetical protein
MPARAVFMDCFTRQGEAVQCTSGFVDVWMPAFFEWSSAMWAHALSERLCSPQENSLLRASAIVTTFFLLTLTANQ